MFTSYASTKNAKNNTWLVFICLVAFISCKKTDFPISNNLPENAKVFKNRNFFTIRGNVPTKISETVLLLSQQNIDQSVLIDYATQNGLPIWEKAIFVIENAATKTKRGQNLNSGDTVMYVPLVLNNANTVNGFIRVAYRDSIHTGTYLGIDYNRYAINTNQNQTLRSHFALFHLMLDDITFGNKKFKILNNTIFNDLLGNQPVKDVEILNRYNTPGEASGLLAQVTRCMLVRFNHGDDDFQNNNTSNILVRSTVKEVCTTSTEWLPDGPGGNFSYYSPPPLPTGGGGGQTYGPFPRRYPCNSSIPYPLREGNLPPCPPPTEEIAWVPFIKPCALIDSLVSNATNQRLFTFLKGETNTNKEVAFFTANALAVDPIYSFKEGDSLLVTVELGTSIPVTFIVHTHVFDTSKNGILSIFSYGDLLAIDSLRRGGMILDKSLFTFMIITNNSSYILTIDDPAKFDAFCKAPLGLADGDKNVVENNDDIYYKRYNIAAKNNVTDNEKGFLRYLQEKDAGIKLFKGNMRMTEFKPIQLNSSGDVVAGNCM
jgi:hypothetical protein